MKLPNPTLPNVRIPAGITSGKTGLRGTSHGETKQAKQAGSKNNKRRSSIS